MIFTGVHPSKLLVLKKEHINIKDEYFTVEESKTAAGIRLVPISDKIISLVRKRYESAFTYYFEKNGKKVGYDHFYRLIFEPIIAQLQLNPLHRPHDTHSPLCCRIER